MAFPKSGSYADTSKQIDNIKRDSKKLNYLGLVSFVGLRALDPVLQYGILVKGIGVQLVSALGGKTIASVPLSTTGLLSSVLALTPYPAVLIGMSVAAAVKQSFTILAITTEETTVPFAFMIAGYNTLFNSLNNLLFLWTMTSPLCDTTSEDFFQTPQLVAGTALYAVGITIEVASEIQRLIWKKEPENKGKVYTGGLFSFARHINFFGYLLCRAGYAVAGGSWVWGAIVGAFFFHDFTRRAIPALQHYLEEKYGAAYEKYKIATPYTLCPLLY